MERSGLIFETHIMELRVDIMIKIVLLTMRQAQNIEKKEKLHQNMNI